MPSANPVALSYGKVRGFRPSLMRVSFFRLGFRELEDWRLTLEDEIGRIESSPQFSPAFCCSGSRHVYCVPRPGSSTYCRVYTCVALPSHAFYPCLSAPPRCEIR